ncbi:Colicin V production protein [Quadrisphaera granulorum]|uniref:Colicin V production protein n=1 Tax=Quadrisphaera granulorum TaxID=317664 RepID=A0A316A8P2_9ACTN|nr:MarP family serine protease [Quadrisphaera granulorum]PWJ53350.1 colicin V production protein [Quadrisphaera granulorum]SZE97024.1 Colicin V production protein [Quadrisphaera granulorum]
MSTLDVVLLLLLIVYGLSGLRQGLVVGLLSVGAFIAGAGLGMWLLPLLVERMEPGRTRTVVVVVGVLLIAWGCQLLGAMLGRRLREVITWQPAQVVDSALGAVAAVVAVALVAWFVAGAVRAGPMPTLARAVASSRVIATIGTLVPPQADTLFAGFRSVVEANDFPRVFSGTGAEPVTPVAAPNDAVVGGAASVAQGGIVKVTGTAEACRRGSEGSGFVVAPQRVVTNAHVVAGVDAPQVQVGGKGERYDATVVLFDPAEDLAVLAVPKLRAEPLGTGRQLGASADAVVAGFPQDGPFTAVPARVREVVRAEGKDIYGEATVIRQVYSLAADIEPGNSGGPLLDPGGNIVGVVFARSLTDTATGYALTLDEARPVLQKAQEATQPVSTGRCTSG